MHSNRIATFLVAFVVSLFCSTAWANESRTSTVVLPPDSLPSAIGGQFQYAADPDARLTIDAVRSMSESDWRSTNTDTPNFGFTGDAYWFRGDIQNTAEAREWVLQLGYPLLDHVDLYVIRDGVVTEHHQTGDRLPFAERPIEFRHFLFPLTLSENESIQVYLRIHTSSAVQMPLSITTGEQLFQTEQRLLAGHGMYFGIIAVMVIYNLFILFSTRDRAYIFYVLLVLTVGGFQLSLHGFAYQFVWPESPWLQDKMTGLFVALASLFGAWFTLVFLNLREYAVWLSGILRVIMVISTVAALLSPFIPYQYTIQIAAATALICVTVAQVSGLYVWYRGYKPAIFYSLAFGMLLMGTAMMILNKFGLLPMNAFTENGQQIGSLAQLVLLSFALAYRIKVLRDETEQAQLQATTMLEGRVRERTLELEEANTKLQELSSKDPLTGTMNRRYFDEQLVAEWNRSLREQMEISVIMLDIDHFKSFNDTYGHQTGDDCLVFLVGHVQDSVLRATDVVVRYGGEEFAVVLPGTDAEGAETVAERIKDKLNRNPFPIGETTVPITVSQGICTMVPQVGELPETLIKRADQALYQAKDEGRDRWLHYQKKDSDSVTATQEP